MAFRLKPVQMSSLLSLFFVGVVACATPQHFYLRYDREFIQSDLNKILTEHPLSAEENIKVVTLGKGQAVSHHVVQIRDREVPHIHKDHELTVVMLRGRGYLVLEQKRIDLAVGDVLFIPRGIIHYFINTFTQPSVALAVFSPPFDGKDTIPVEKP